MRKNRKAFHADRVDAGTRQVETTAPQKTHHRNADTKTRATRRWMLYKWREKSRKS